MEKSAERRERGAGAMEHSAWSMGHGVWGMGHGVACSVNFENGQCFLGIGNIS